MKAHRTSRRLGTIGLLAISMGGMMHGCLATAGFFLERLLAPTSLENALTFPGSIFEGLAPLLRGFG